MRRSRGNRSFFSRIKSKLSQDFGGRYLGIILEQVILEEPSFVRAIFPHISSSNIKRIKSGEVKVTSEFEFSARIDERRRADLALVDMRSGSPIALAEIKYEDQNSGGNYAQLKDYVAYLKKFEGANFTYLTQHAPQIQKLPELLTNVAQRPGFSVRFYRDLYAATNGYGNLSIKWLREFLEEQHVVYSEALGENSWDLITLLLIKGLGVRHRHGFGKLTTRKNLLESTELLSDLYGNTAALADWFYGEYRTHFGRRFELDLMYRPDFYRASLEYDLESANPKATIVAPSRDSRAGGYMIVLARGTMCSAPYLSLSFGYYFELSLDHSQVWGGFDCWLECQGSESEYEFSEEVKFGEALKLSEAKAHSVVCRLVVKTLTKALSDKNLPNHAKPKIRGLLGSLSITKKAA